jgi:hypothetical protein
MMVRRFQESIRVIRDRVVAVFCVRLSFVWWSDYGSVVVCMYHVRVNLWLGCLSVCSRADPECSSQPGVEVTEGIRGLELEVQRVLAADDGEGGCAGEDVVCVVFGEGADALPERGDDRCGEGALGLLSAGGGVGVPGLGGILFLPDLEDAIVAVSVL